MPDKIINNQELGIIEIQSTGTVSKDDITSSIKSILKEYDGKDDARVLIDTTEQQSMPSITEIFNIFSDFPHKIKAAIFKKQTQSTSDDLRFIETVTQNRGFKIKEFLSREEAIEWLRV